MAKNTPTKEEKERFMSRAIELSNEGPSKGHGGPYGAIVVKDGKIIGNARQLLLYMSRVFQAPVWDDLQAKQTRNTCRSLFLVLTKCWVSKAGFYICFSELNSRYKLK